MAFHRLNKRCDECGGIYAVRMPNRTLLVSKIVVYARCPTCHPEDLTDVCAACRIPLAITRPIIRCGRSGEPAEMCRTCAQRERRAKKREAERVTNAAPLLPLQHVA